MPSTSYYTAKATFMILLNSSHTYHPLTSSLKGYALSEIIAILNVYKNAIFQRKKLSQYAYYVICFLIIYVYRDFVFNSKTFLFNLILSNILINTTDEATWPT